MSHTVIVDINNNCHRRLITPHRGSLKQYLVDSPESFGKSNNSGEKPHRRLITPHRGSLKKFLADCPDLLIYPSSEDEELEYDHWPGQIELVSTSTENEALNGFSLGQRKTYRNGLSDSLDDEDESYVLEMENEIGYLRERNSQLVGANKELQAAMLNRDIQEGKDLINGRSDDSLNAEFETMDESEIRAALKEQTEVNASLRGYIDGILMRIIDKYPDILEVKKSKRLQ